jgi:hypothetical protein
MGKAWHHRALSNYLYLFVWARFCILFIFFSNSPSVIEHVLNWNVRQAWKNLYNIGIVSYKDSFCLVPFSSNISCVLSLLWLDEKKKVILPGTSEVHSKKILLLSTPSCRHYCDCNAWHSEWGFAPRMITTNHVSLLNESWEGNDTALCVAKQQTYEFSKITHRLRNYYSGGAYVHNWVKWPERESDHKLLSDVEIMSGTIFLCLYMSIRSI